MIDDIKDYLEGVFMPLEHGTKKAVFMYALLMVCNIISSIMIITAFYLSFKHNLDFLTAFVMIVYTMMVHDYIKGLRASMRLIDYIKQIQD